MLKLPNSESVGFQSLGLGSGDAKIHAPKTGTVLEPCWNLGEIEPRWQLAGTFVEPRWITGTLREPCWSIAGTLLEPAETAGTLLETR